MAGLIPLPIVEDGVMITTTSGSDVVAWQAPRMHATVPTTPQDRDGPDRAEAAVRTTCRRGHAACESAIRGAKPAMNKINILDGLSQSRSQPLDSLHPVFSESNPQGASPLPLDGVRR